MMRLKSNRLRCKKCGDVIESHYGHDFKYCKCGAIFTDGGLEYVRFGWPGGDPNDYVEQLSEYEDGTRVPPPSYMRDMQPTPDSDAKVKG